MSPPPFPARDSGIYCIDSSRQRKRLTLRPLSPVSENVVSSTVENAWQFYHNRYYNGQSLSMDSVYDSQVVFLRSYSGFFNERPNFENCYRCLLKPDDLKAAIRLRLDRLSPGPSEIAGPVRNSPLKKGCDSTRQRKSNLADKTSDTAKSMEALIRAGAIPGVTLDSKRAGTIPGLSDYSDSSATTPLDRRLSTSLFGNAGFQDEDWRRTIPEEISECHHRLRESFTDTRKPSQLPSEGNIFSRNDTAIPFLNDGTVEEILRSAGNEERDLDADDRVEMRWHDDRSDTSYSDETVNLPNQLDEVNTQPIGGEGSMDSEKSSADVAEQPSPTQPLICGDSNHADQGSEGSGERYQGVKLSSSDPKPTRTSLLAVSRYYVIQSIHFISLLSPIYCIMLGYT